LDQVVDQTGFYKHGWVTHETNTNNEDLRIKLGDIQLVLEDTMQSHLISPGREKETIMMKKSKRGHN